MHAFGAVLVGLVHRRRSDDQLVIDRVAVVHDEPHGRPRSYAQAVEAVEGAVVDGDVDDYESRTQHVVTVVRARHALDDVADRRDRTERDRTDEQPNEEFHAAIDFVRVRSLYPSTRNRPHAPITPRNSGKFPRS